MLAGDLWKRHDSSNLLLHISVLTNGFFLLGFIFWFGPRWKYFGPATAVVLLVCIPVVATLSINEKDTVGVVFSVSAFLSVILLLKKEIAKLKSLSKSQSDANQQQERGVF
jgi:hypothetical protein